MSADRKSLLEDRSRALRVMADPEAPQNVRQAYRKAADHADVVLSLQEAQGRLKPRQKQASPALLGQGATPAPAQDQNPPLPNPLSQSQGPTPRSKTASLI